MVRKDTRTALLDAGEALLLEGGYDFAATNAILELAKAPRGSFYHHFESKQAFVLAVAERWYEGGSQALDVILTDDSRAPLVRLRAYFVALIESYKKLGCERGCMLGMLGQELSGRDEESRKRIQGLFGRWRHRLADCLREAQALGDLSRTESADELAGYLIDSWEGALLQMKVQCADRPLAIFLDVTFRKVLRS